LIRLQQYVIETYKKAHEPSVSKVLGLDVGSTFIKTARLAGGQIQQATFQRSPMPPFIAPVFLGSCWVAPGDFFAALDSALTADELTYGRPGKIFISGQMHGATLCEVGAVKPLVPISTWQDRSARDFESGKRWQDVNSALTPALLAKTGNELDFGHPLVVLPLLKSQLTDGSKNLRFTSLISIVAEHLVGQPVTSHISDAAASGMYDPFTQRWVPELLNLAGVGNVKLPETTEQVAAVGRAKSETLVFVGVGDHQTSLFGGESSEVDSATEICVNVGTGAQISSLNPKLGGKHRLRPKLGGGFFTTVPDLPAGRELSSKAVTFSGAAEAYLQAAHSIHEGEIKSVALTGSIFTAAPEFAKTIEATFEVPVRITEDEPALGGLARLATRD
jgi:xylulokinase